MASAESQMSWKPRFSETKAGALAIAAGGPQSTLDAPEALIHDWAAATFVAGGTLEQSLRGMQDYDGYQRIYGPQVAESKLLERNGDRFRVYLKLNKSKGLISAVLNSEYDVAYKTLSADRRSMISRSSHRKRTAPN